MSVKDAVLQALEQARGEQISGEALARSLGVSRAAVWKAVAALRDAGAQIDAAPGGGYLLRTEDDSLTAAGISALLDTADFGRELLVVPKLSSTNTVLKQEYTAKPHGFTLIALEQSGGRGRLGRSFASPPGSGLYLSVLMHPQFPLSQLQFVTVAAAVAVCEAIEQTAGFTPGIKWVNDVLMHGKKLCGILTEAVIEGETGLVDAVITGFGINLSPSPAWPEEVRAVAGALSEFAKPPRRAVLAAALLAAFERGIRLLDAGDTAGLVAAYRGRLCCLGQPVTVHGPAAQYSATCVGLNEDAHLLVRDLAGQTHTLSSGEISIRLSPS